MADIILPCVGLSAILLMSHRYPVKKFVPSTHGCITCKLALVGQAVSENRCLKIIVIYTYEAPGQDNPLVSDINMNMHFSQYKLIGDYSLACWSG